MGKHALLVGVLLSLSFTSQGQQMPTITLSPLPPKAGDTVTITYTGRPGTVLNLDWHPAGEPPTVTVGADGTVTVKVPTSATSLIVSDPVGGAPDESTVIAH